MTVTSQSLPHLHPMGRCQSLEMIWPQVQRLVISQFNSFWSNTNAYTDRYRHRRDAFHDLARAAFRNRSTWVGNTKCLRCVYRVFSTTFLWNCGDAVSPPTK